MNGPVRCLVAAGAAFALLIAGVVNPATAAPKPPTVKVKVQFTTPYVSCDPDGDYVRAVAGVLVQPIGPGVKVNRQLTNRDGWVEFALPVGAQVRFGVIYSSKELELRPGSVKSSRYTWFTPPIDVPRVSMQKSFNINSHFAAAVANLWVEARKAVVAARSATVERLPKLIVVSEIDQTFEGRMATLETNFDSDSRVVTIGSVGEFSKYLDKGGKKAEREWEGGLIAHQVGHWLFEYNLPSEPQLDDGNLPIEDPDAHEWEKIYPDNAAMVVREGFSHAFSTLVSGDPAVSYGCESEFDLEPDGSSGSAANACGVPEWPTPAIKPCADYQLSQYNEIMSAAAFRKTWNFLGEGDLSLGTWQSLRAMRWFKSNAKRVPESMRDVFDAVIRSDAVRLGSRDDLPSSQNLAKFMSLFSDLLMTWGGRVSADLYSDPDFESWGSPSVLVTLTGPLTSCSTSYDAERTEPIRGAEYYEEYTADIDGGPLDYTWLDDCIGRSYGGTVRLPYSAPRGTVGTSAKWTIKVTYLCEDIDGDDPRDRCKSSLPVPIYISRDDINELCGTDPSCTYFSAVATMTMSRGVAYDIMTFEPSGACALHPAIETQFRAEGDLYGCRS